MKNKIKIFLAFGAFLSFNAIAPMEEDPNDLLMHSIEKEDFEGVVNAMHKGAKVNYSHPKFSHHLPLHEAVGKDHQKITSWLVSQPDIEVDKPDATHQWTPLHIAAFYGLDEIAALLIEHGASLNVQTQTLQTPLHKAVEAERLSTVYTMLTQVPQENAPKPPCLFTLLCCFHRCTKQRKKKIPKDIQLLICRYYKKGCLEKFDPFLKDLQPLLEMKNNSNQTPYSLALIRLRNYTTNGQYPGNGLQDGEELTDVQKLTAITRLLNPKDDTYRRMALERVIYGERKIEVPGISCHELEKK